MKHSFSGWLNGFLGVIIFSGSLPATRAAIADFDPVFLTGGRATIAGILALLILSFMRSRSPSRNDLASLIMVAAGVVVGFPLFSAIALQHISAARSLVFVGILPLVTAIFGVMRGDEQPGPIFWVFAVLGSICVMGFALIQGTEASLQGDILMLIAVAICGYSYAEGGRLSRHMGGWQVICWALVLSLPLMVTLAVITRPLTWQHIGNPAWIGLIYISLFSMLIGFFFWYRGLAEGGIATVGQLQLLQPFFGLVLAATLLQESIDRLMLVTMIAVVLCVAGARIFAARS